MSATTSVADTTAAAEAANNTNKKVILKSCAPFTDCMSKINNTQVDNTKDFDIVMRIYNIIKYSDNYLRTSGSLWQYYFGFTGANQNSKLFKYNQKITGQTFNASWNS